MSTLTESSDGRAGSWYTVRVWNVADEDLHLASSYMDKTVAQQVARSLAAHYEGRLHVDIRQWRPQHVDIILEE